MDLLTHTSQTIVTYELRTIVFHERWQIVVIDAFVRKCFPKYLCGVHFSSSVKCVKICV